MTNNNFVATRKSRIAKYPVAFGAGVHVSVAGGLVRVSGPLGNLELSLSDAVLVNVTEGSIAFEPVPGKQDSLAMSGTVRALVFNMVAGVTKGFEKRLNLVGVGYRAQAQGDKLNLGLGFSHPVVHAMPIGVKVETPSQTEIVLKGVDKQLIGQVAAEIRGYRPPEPYKGKGVRYAGERVVLKETKKK